MTCDYCGMAPGDSDEYDDGCGGTICYECLYELGNDDDFFEPRDDDDAWEIVDDYEYNLSDDEKQLEINWYAHHYPDVDPPGEIAFDVRTAYPRVLVDKFCRRFKGHFDDLLWEVQKRIFPELINPDLPF